MQLQNITEGAARALLGNVCFSKATLAKDATTASGFQTTGVISYTIDGSFKTKAAITRALGGVYSTGHDSVLAGYSCIFAYCLDAAGNIATFQGQPFKAEGDKFRGYKPLRGTDGVVTGYQQELALASNNCAFAPSIPAGYIVFGLGKIAATAVFAPGTTNHDTGNTATFTDVMAIPANTNL